MHSNFYGSYLLQKVLVEKLVLTFEEVWSILLFGLLFYNCLLAEKFIGAWSISSNPFENGKLGIQFKIIL